MQKLQSFFLKLKSRQANRNNKVIRQMVPYSEARNIGILFMAPEEGYQAINRLVQKLKDEGKQIKALTYVEQNQSTGYDFNFDYFSKEQLTTTGNIKSDKVARFIETRFDYLFCIHTHSFLPFDYILLQSNAKYRIGMYLEEKPECFEFMIKPLQNQALAQTIDQLLHYTQALTVHGK
jgi:GR25 family glycosyltransferase involved in LPS biosynthesis